MDGKREPIKHENANGTGAIANLMEFDSFAASHRKMFASSVF